MPSMPVGGKAASFRCAVPLQADNKSCMGVSESRGALSYIQRSRILHRRALKGGPLRARTSPPLSETFRCELEETEAVDTPPAPKKQARLGEP